MPKKQRVICICERKILFDTLQKALQQLIIFFIQGSQFIRITHDGRGASASLSNPKILFLTVFRTIYKNLLKRKVTVVTMLQYYGLFPKFLFSLTKKLYDWTDPSAPTPSSGTPMLMARWSTCRWPPRYICGHHRVITSRGAKIVVFFKFETFCCPFFGSRHCTCANIRWCEEKGVELFL